ncbi:MAG: Fic family protein [Prevotella sp.]|nr:Fic family protein [Bacteroidales bacterium]MCM1068732.1 Fic family protein [Prevotella sp.]MCM1577132.1 Fic family protein [Bacteroides sp.]
MNTSLRLPAIDFDMPITDMILELEKLRYKVLSGTTHPIVFQQIKAIFQMLESIGSSRIEGNNTTIMDYIETTKIQNSEIHSWHEDIQEIENIERATQYIEDNIGNMPITMMFIRELHLLTVQKLSYQREGAVHKGEFRRGNVRIGGSKHTPPDYTQVESLMQELIDFVNTQTPPKFDLLKIAIAHHRFVWIHPFENGNGRVVRLFTYALLLKFVFKSRDRIINPTAVFCSNREKYYNYLSEADKGTDEGLIAWASYMLQGLKDEIEKIDHLTDYNFLQKEILLPTLQDALRHQYITQTEFEVLKRTIEVQVMQSSDLLNPLGNLGNPERSRIIRSLLNKQMLFPIQPNARKYVISFSNNYLLRSMLAMLDRAGFLPTNEPIILTE